MVAHQPLPSRIVGAFGVPHTPHFPAMAAAGTPIGRELERLYGTVREHLRAVAPDAIVFLTSDHYNLFWETIPIFAVAVAETATGPSDYRELPNRVVRLDPGLARWVQRHAVDAGFDVGMCQELELDHSVMVPLHFLTPEMDVPVVPLFTSAFVRPIPSAARCRALGAAIRDAVERLPGERRVAVVATGSFSLEIGGPRIGPSSHTGVPDPGWVDRVVALLEAAEVDELVAAATDDQLAEAGNAGGELLSWIALLGAIPPRRPAFLEAQPDYGHAYATWPLDVRAAP